MGIEGIPPYPEELVKKYRERRWWVGLTLADVFNKTADLLHYREALVDERQRLTYAQLRNKVDRLAIALLELGIKRGDSIILQLPNCAEWIITYFACQKIGVSPVSTPNDSPWASSTPLPG